MSTVRSAAAAIKLAEYAQSVELTDIPDRVSGAAQLCLTDAVACAIFGARFPWSRILRDHALSSGAKGQCFLPGLALSGLHVEQAALIAGSYAHAFELDSLRKPGAGVHPGATVALPAFVVAQETGASGADLLRAIVAGCEVMCRIGDATLHSAESRGFHAPGITGVFGSAVAAGLLRSLSTAQLVAALGIAGSMASGLLAFARSGGGGMVKRLHLGRAAQNGVIAADLAARGYEGPETVLDGDFGVLEAFCPKHEVSRLTADLGSAYQLDRLCLKRYACHVTAQSPIQFLRRSMSTEGFAAEDIASVDLGVSEKVRSHHAEKHPQDVTGAQYSVPFAFATAAYFDPDDPMSFARENIADPAVIDLAERISLLPAEDGDKWAAEITVHLRNGRTVSGVQRSFKGSPEDPFSSEDMAQKFRNLTDPAGSRESDALLRSLQELPSMPDLRALQELAPLGASAPCA